MKNKFIGAVAAAAAIAFITAPVTSTLAQAKASTKAACYGVNSCKGKSSCKTAMNECKGKNSCKGKGMSMKSEKQCKKLKGSATEPAATPATPETPAAEAPKS
ncbi:MAG: hypothetical protein NTW94_04590 [Legionellales bacterium]|nr:hypothetical protein [Legionellales bacterium]